MKKVLLFLYCFLVLFSKSYSQHQGVEEKPNVIQSSGTIGGGSWDNQIDLAIQLFDIDNEKALAFVNQAERLVIASSDSACMITTQRFKGQILGRLGRTDEALTIFRRILPAARRFGLPSDQLGILISYANTCTYLSQYDKALQNYFEAFEVAVTLQDTTSLELVDANIGFIYYKLKDYRKALFHWSESSRSEKSRGISDYQRDMNISLAYANLKDFKNAKKALAESIRLCGDKCSEKALMHIRYTSGTISLGLHDYNSAREHFLESYEFSKVVFDDRMLLDNICMLADVYQKQNDTKRALFYLNEGEQLIKKGIPFILEITKLYHRFAELYMAIKDYEKAALYQGKYVTLKDSIYSEHFTTSLIKTETDHLENINAAKLAAQREVISLREQMLSRQTILNIVTGCLALSILAFSLILYRDYRRKKNLNILLEQKVKERTLELEFNRNDLTRSLKERDLTIKRAALQVNEVMKTIKGLCSTGVIESKGKGAYSYFERIDQTSSQLAEIVDSRHNKLAVDSR